MKTTNIIPHRCWASGIWKWLNWVVLIHGLSWDWCQVFSWGCHLKAQIGLKKKKKNPFRDCSCGWRRVSVPYWLLDKRFRSSSYVGLSTSRSLYSERWESRSERGRYRSSRFWNCSIRKWTDMTSKVKSFLCWKCSWWVKILGHTQNHGKFD